MVDVKYVHIVMYSAQILQEILFFQNEAEE